MLARLSRSLPGTSSATLLWGSPCRRRRSTCWRICAKSSGRPLSPRCFTVVKLGQSRPISVSSRCHLGRPPLLRCSAESTSSARCSAIDRGSRALHTHPPLETQGRRCRRPALTPSASPHALRRSAAPSRCSRSCELPSTCRTTRRRPPLPPPPAPSLSLVLLPPPLPLWPRPRRVHRRRSASLRPARRARRASLRRWRGGCSSRAL